MIMTKKVRGRDGSGDKKAAALDVKVRRRCGKNE